MKHFIVLSCVLFACHAINPELLETMRTHVLQLAGECKTEIGATDDDIAPILTHNPPTTTNGKCFVSCVQEKLGFQDAAGHFSKEKADAVLEKMKAMDEEFYGKMKKVSDACLDSVQDTGDKCETGVNMFICIQKEKKAAGLEPMDFKS